MAQQSKKINVAELDFDKIKTNFKEFLRGQSEFSDYDFEGSALSTLIDVLAYNTHYNALYTNFAVNEMFLDSASKRNSVVSIANMLGYVPASATAAQSNVILKFTNLGGSPASTYTLDAYQPFTTTVSGVSYTFYTTDSVTAPLLSNAYTFSNLVIKEGTFLTYSYVASSGLRYIIPNVDVDTSTLQVSVQDFNTGAVNTYNRSNSIVNVGADSMIYFLKEIDNQQYEIEFGDGVLGKALNNGDIITMKYIVCNKSDANNAKTFTYAGTKPSGSTVTVTTLTSSYGGSEQETLESIKFNAPRSFSSQDRAVTIEDYKNIILQYFTYIDSVAVWGGETNNPPMYGKVFISAKPQANVFLTSQQKTDIKNLIYSKSVAATTPVIVDPEYLDIVLDISVYYDQTKTSLTSTGIVSSVSATVEDYNTTELSKFDAIFRHSKFSRLVDLTHSSILSNITKPTIRKYVTPYYNQSSEYKINIVNPIYSAGAIGQGFTSSGFYINSSDKIHYLTDDGTGNVQLYYVLPLEGTETKVIINPSIGTIKYSSGYIAIRNLNITSLVSGSQLIFYIRPESYDIVSAFNQVIKIDMASTTINAIADSTFGNQALANNYIFTSSRS